MTSTCRLAVTGPLPAGLVETITDRFGTVRTCREGTDTVLDVEVVDQPSLRALLTLLWDAGHDVHDVSLTADGDITAATDPRRP